MKKIKFIHSADIHLDTPFKGLASVDPELAGELKNATFKSFEKIIRLCIEHRVDFLLVAGDIFDSKFKSLSAQMKFLDGLNTLSSHGIRAYFICGNHDPLDSWMETLKLPENVVRFGSSKVEEAIFDKNGEALAGIYGISYRTNREKRDLASKFPVPKKLPFSIALMHGTVGNPGPHQNYAPFKIEDIAQKGYDYWALGHIHKKEILRKKDPAVVYPGNPQGRDFGETGPRGCFLVEIEENNAPEIRFVETQQSRFENIKIEINNISTINELKEKFESSIKDFTENEFTGTLILRFELEGRTSLHEELRKNSDELKNWINDKYRESTPRVITDKIKINSRPEIDIDKIRKQNDFTAEVLEETENINGIDELIEKIESEAKLQSKFKVFGDLTPEDEMEIRERIKWLLLENLVNED